MKILQRLRELMEGVPVEMSAGHAGSGAAPLSREKFDVYQTDEVTSTLSPLFGYNEWEVLGQTGRRRIPDIHEELPPQGYPIGSDEEGFDPA